MTEVEGKWPQAMGFYHPDGLKPSVRMAGMFAGEGGHLATLPDIIEARLNSHAGDVPWETYYTTMSAEYVGLDREGNKKIVVAHGVGPMANLDGIMAAYSWQYKDKTRNKHGGRISQEEFWRLLDGEYGEVYVVDFDGYIGRYEYPFLEILRASEAMTDPLLLARFGPHAAEYIAHHAAEAKRWHLAEAGIPIEDYYGLFERKGSRDTNPEALSGKLPRKLKKAIRKPDGALTPKEQNAVDNFWKRHSPYQERANLHRQMHIVQGGLASSDPYILKIDDASSCNYIYRDIEPGMAFAHLLSIGALMNLHHTEDTPIGTRISYQSMVGDVSAHGWHDGCRFVGIREGGFVTIEKGPNPRKVIEENWSSLLTDVSEQPYTPGFSVLTRLSDGTYFTQVAKQAAALDTGEPEFLVTSLEPVGEPALFVTEVHGYYGLFRYLLRDVEAIAPKGANAYILASDPELMDGAEHQKVLVQFFKAVIDGTRRLPDLKKVENDFDLLMSFMAA